MLPSKVFGRLKSMGHVRFPHNGSGREGFADFLSVEPLPATAHPAAPLPEEGIVSAIKTSE